MAVPVRTRAAVAVGRVAAAASRRLRRGHGAIIGGRVALALDPNALERLVDDRPVTIVTGTNGKTTTTRLVAEALSCANVVASNRGGNMPPGLIEAAAEPGAHELVLEVDELYVPRVLAATRASTLVLLNISRDQLDRITEIRSIAERWRAALAAADWPITVVANCDDPLVVWAVGDHQRVSWVAAGARWREDAALCPQCGRPRPIALDGAWSCDCGLSRPTPDHLVDPTLQLDLPGDFNRSNAAIALAVAALRGIPADQARKRVAAVRDVGGRYETVHVDGRDVRLHLAKNPASWGELLSLIASNTGSSALLCVNARVADGMDTSWLWDVPFEELAGRAVTATGDRRLDLSLRLRVGGVGHVVAPSLIDAIHSLPEGAVELFATYTAFHDVLRELKVDW